MHYAKTWFAAIALTLMSVTAMPGAAQTTQDMTRGEVRKVDKEAGKITIKHEEIKNLDMPPMTMVFTVKDKSLLEQAKPGDKVVFTVSREDGALVVTRLQPVP